jgi:UDP-N-acetylmuramate dehydrogenase
MKYQTDQKLKDYTTLKIGGPVSRFYEPHTIEDIQEILQDAREADAQLIVLGRGSNILADDEGFDGWIVHLLDNFKGIEDLGEGKVRVLAGTTNGELAEALAEMGLGGFEFASGIPGTVGGAVIMNAGAYGGEVIDVITKAAYLDWQGNLHEVSKDDLDLSYRHSMFMDKFGIVVWAEFQFAPRDKEEILEKMAELKHKRWSKQPMEDNSAGSTFKRPVGGYASALISENKLQGLSVGDAEVSTKHAGFLINKGNASCKEFLELVGKVQKAVKENNGIDLELEVQQIHKDTKRKNTN